MSISHHSLVQLIESLGLTTENTSLDGSRCDVTFQPGLTIACETDGEMFACYAASTPIPVRQSRRLTFSADVNHLVAELNPHLNMVKLVMTDNGDVCVRGTVKLPHDYRRQQQNLRQMLVHVCRTWMSLQLRLSQGLLSNDLTAAETETLTRMIR